MRDEKTMLDEIRDFFFVVEEEELNTQFEVDSLVLVLTNCTLAEGPKLAEKLVLEHYAACVNVIPGVRSYYMWEGEFHVDAESTLLIKTMEPHVDELVRRLRQLHSYDTPEIVMLKPDAVDGRYRQWALEQTSVPSP